MARAVDARSLQSLPLRGKAVLEGKAVQATSCVASKSSVGKKMSADLRREQIVRVLLSLISKRSPGEISTQLIADTAGVSQATIFKHFSTKADLWAATALWLGTELDKIWIRSHAKVAPNEALHVLEEIFLGAIEFFCRYPAVVRIMMSDSLRHEFSDVQKISQMLHQRYEQEILLLLRLAIKSKAVDDKLDHRAAVTLFFCCIRGLGFQIATSNRSSNFRKEASNVLQLYLNAIGGRS
ncbi:MULTISPECIES: TetR/AcrR family transcriptional regulator [unclassified Afipia]|uniref:TetR/AcrR family transcriptional regulator n=1 Tax=unclassified Afipia TaxID=2642050 RepID=UPI0012695AE8|nr:MULTISPECIES: TetR/AcrR family transcriptional regulator [unclassified Afipia]